MGAADLENVLKRLSFVLERLVKPGKRWVEPVGDFLSRGDMHGRGKDIVGGLAEIDVIIGVNQDALNRETRRAIRSRGWR